MNKLGNGTDAASTTPQQINPALPINHDIEKLCSPEVDKENIPQNVQEVISLFAASEDENLSEFSRIMKEKGGIDCMDSLGWTPLTYCASIGNISGLKVLIGANAFINQKNVFGDTPLLAAISGGNLEAVDELLKAGASTRVRGSFNEHVLMRAAIIGKITIIERLLANGADIYASNLEKNASQLETAINILFENENIEALELFIRYGMDLEMRNVKGDTYLMKCSYEGKKGLVEFLIRAGAGKDKVNKKGDTALILAAKNNQKDIIDILMNAGANPVIKNSEKKSLIDYIIDSGDIKFANEIRERLTSYGIRGRIMALKYFYLKFR